jgi:hypothetical protein
MMWLPLVPPILRSLADGTITQATDLIYPGTGGIHYDGLVVGLNLKALGSSKSLQVRPVMRWLVTCI